MTTPKLEWIVGYTGDGEPVDVFFLDGTQIEVSARVDIDTDDQLARGYTVEKWKAKHESNVARVSPAAGEVVRKFVQLTLLEGSVPRDWEDEPEAA